MMSTDDFTFWLDSGDAKSLANFFQDMAEKDRRAFVKPLKEFLQTTLSSRPAHENWRDRQDRMRHAGQTLVPAAMAVFPSAGATARFLRRVQRSGLFDPRETAAIQQVLAERAPAWLTDLPAALLDTLDPEGAYEVAAAVGETAGVKVVPTPAFLRAWASKYRWRVDDQILKTELLQEPRFAELLPLVFDHDENDDLFTSAAVFRVAALTAVKRGQASRPDVLDASLRRLLRGGRVTAMQDHLAFWNALHPVDGELIARASSCVSLLSSQNGPIARTFLAALKDVSDHGLLDVELTVEAASIAVTRPEKNVVKTTLGWLDGLAEGNPSRAGQFVGIIATAFGAQAADLQERAVKLVGKHAKALGKDERERLVAEARIHLAPDLAAMLAGLLGVSQDSSMDDAGAGYPDVAPYVPRPLLPPIASPAELAEVIASLLHADPLEAMVFERVLEAVVLFERTDSEALREALEPVIEHWRPGWAWSSSQPPLTPRNALCMLAAAAAGVGEDARRQPHRESVGQLWSRARTSTRGWWRRSRTTPADFLIMRAVELHAALGMPDLPPLVSVPTSPTGGIEPEVLAARLRECEAQGWEPLEADFHQALLRLPDGCGNVDVSGLTSAAGLRFAAWVAGERVELPVAEIPDPQIRELARTGQWDTEALRTAMRGQPVVPQTLLDLAPAVWRRPERSGDESDWTVCWPAVLPSRPDLAAMAMIGGLDWSTAPPSPESAVVLAEQDGAQDGTHQVIAARLVDDDVKLRASGVDAALVLAARGLLDPLLLGNALTGELTARSAGTRRVVSGLRDLANGGAAGAAWEAVAVVLPGILPPAVPKTLSGTSDLLTLATELAGALGVRTPVTEVSALAEKKGGSAVANAARRLDAVLRAG